MCTPTAGVGFGEERLSTVEKVIYTACTWVQRLVDKKCTFAALGPQLYLELPPCFAKGYFLRKHFLHGIYGFIASVKYAHDRFVCLAVKGDR